MNFKSELNVIYENVQIKKERSGTTGFALPQIEIPLLPPSVTPKEGSRLKCRGLFGDNSPVKMDTKEDVKWHLQDKAEEEPGAVESPPLSATVVRQLMHKSVAAIAAFYGYDQVIVHEQIDQFTSDVEPLSKSKLKLQCSCNYGFLCVTLFCVQPNLCTATTQKKWLLLTGGRCSEIY